MKRLLASTVTAAVVLLGTGREAEAQGMMNRRASLFDLGVYAGAAHNTTWATGNNGTNYGPGNFNPIFGAHATFWATPGLGFRTHGAYMPHSFGSAGEPGFFAREGRVVNTWLYDLDVVFRPFFARDDMANLMGSMYFFLGGGAVTSNVAGTNQLGCIGGATGPASQSVCLPLRPLQATVGQGTVGLGVDVLPIGNSLGLFAELATHIHKGPEHIGPVWTGQPINGASDPMVFTTRANIGLKLMLGDITPVPVVPPVTPPPPPPPAPTPAPPAERTIQVCVIQDGTVRNVEATFVPASGDTVIMRDGQRVQFRQAYPSATGFAAGANWFVGGEPITFQNQRYVRFGLPRVITPPDQVSRVGEFQGVPVFAEPGATGAPSVIYLPIRPTCEFQPYQREAVTRRVRG
jgi:hypothetical protein